MQYIRDENPSGNGEHIAQILENYYGLKKEEELFLEEYRSKNISVKEALERLEAQSSLRIKWLGKEVAQQLFGEQERKMQAFLNSNQPISDSQDKVNSLVATDSIGQSSQPNNELTQFLTEVNQLRDGGASDEEIFEHTASMLGTEHALDIKEQAEIASAWQTKHQAFEQEKTVILQSGLSQEEQAEQLTYLMEQHYTEEELPAAKAYHSR